MNDVRMYRELLQHDYLDQLLSSLDFFLFTYSNFLCDVTHTQKPANIYISPINSPI